MKNEKKVVVIFSNISVYKEIILKQLQVFCYKPKYC